MNAALRLWFAVEGSAALMALVLADLALWGELCLWLRPPAGWDLLGLMGLTFVGGWLAWTGRKVFVGRRLSTGAGGHARRNRT